MTLRVYRDGALAEEAPFDPALVAHALDVASRVWVDAADPTTDELRALQAAFGSTSSPSRTVARGAAREGRALP